jgi:penicillin-binding protein 2
MSVFNQSRKNVVRLVFIAMFLVIVIRLFTLQVIETKYKILAEDQGIFRKVVYPDRGVVFDRKQRAILENTIIYDLMVTPAKIRGTDTAALCRILGIDTAEFRKRIITAIIKNKSYRPSVFEALLSEDKMSRLNEIMYRLAPGYYLQERPVRSYPYDAAGNLVGYLAEVDTSFLRKHPGEGYVPGDYAGKTGLELTYEKVLMGRRGIEYYKRDNKNRIIGRMEEGKYDTTAIAGQDLYSSLDIELQELGEKLMEISNDFREFVGACRRLMSEIGTQYIYWFQISLDVCWRMNFRYRACGHGAFPNAIDQRGYNYALLRPHI